ncbi:M48 family metallopeptidase [Sphingomonas sp. KR3-1]|uniref:M48 family metallopeptidase n=1 Tax=Sphingomonas sp. KR3-1 TaxID=3156611 RepID=UPI0032B42C99
MLFVVACGVFTAGVPAHADDSALFEAVRAADLKVAGIGWRLALANAPLCDRIEAGTGMQLHTLDQFDADKRESAKAHFGFATPVAIEGVVPDSPAERAGLRPDDSLVRVGSVEIAGLSGKPGTTDKLVAAQFAIAALPAESPIPVEVIRAGTRVQVTLQPIRACKSRFELALDGGFGASADGTMVQIGSGFLDAYPDDQIAAVIAHEFAHNILHHRDRLEARGVDYGLLSGFGANVKYFRQTEVQADILSVYLLANAGLSPRAPVAFWRHFGPSKAGGILLSRSHPAWRDRVATLEAEVAKVEQLSVRPVVPALIAERDKPLDGDWQSILVRAH